MRNIKLPVLFIFIAVCFSQTAAQDFWERKPYSEWTKDDIIRLIGESPWAQLRQPQADSTVVRTNTGVTVRVRSALPIRQALVRLKQIEAKYDKMDDRKKAEFDEKLRGTLECPACAGNFVITYSPPISKIPLGSNLGALKTAQFSTLQGKVYLFNDKGERRELVHFVAPKHDQDEATFFFSRAGENGDSLVGGDTKKLIMIFEPETVLATAAGMTLPRRVEFDLQKMIFEGKTEF